jgi:methionyl-tRNA synthetase
MHKLCKGKVPPLHSELLDETDKQLIAEIGATKERVELLLEQYKFREALYEVIDLSRKGNQYMQKKEPWIVAKKLADDAAAQNSIDNTLHICLQLTANLAVLANPILPNTAKKMLHMMKVVDKMLDWENAGKLKLLSVGYSLREPQLLFRKIEDEEIKEQVDKLKANAMNAPKQTTAGTTNAAPAAQENNNSSPIKPAIQYEDFAKIDLKVGTIVSAEKVEKADKLLKLEIDLGFEKRTVVSGIALHHKPEEIIGKQVVVVANLAPRKMRGIESNGMILMAEDGSGKLHFVNPEGAIDRGSGVS